MMGIVFQIVIEP